MFKEQRLSRHFGYNLETLMLTWLGTSVKLTDDQVRTALAAMDKEERQVVMLRCNGLTAEEVAVQEGYNATQVRLLTMAGLRQAAAYLWPEGWWNEKDAVQRLHWGLSPQTAYMSP
jgi:DNA-directed RNA polymerase specialized sigma24 family protein